MLFGGGGIRVKRDGLSKDGSSSLQRNFQSMTQIRFQLAIRFQFSLQVSASILKRFQ
jgi:hypothetical protein